MSLIKSVFFKPDLLKKIKETHEMLIALNARTIEESFLIGSTMNCKRVLGLEEHKEAMIERFYSGEGMWSDFGVFNQIEISNLNHRKALVQRLKAEEHKLLKFLSVDVEELPPHVLREISILGGGYPNITWSLKLLALAVDDNTLIQPNTTPCQKASEFLFGNSFSGDQLGHTILCNRIADETGLTPLEANTALWAIGTDL